MDKKMAFQLPLSTGKYKDLGSKGKWGSTLGLSLKCRLPSKELCIWELRTLHPANENDDTVCLLYSMFSIIQKLGKYEECKLHTNP
jgi:hypothetical protein